MHKSEDLAKVFSEDVKKNHLETLEMLF